jgi:peptidoglycan/LPS O-acetylase OafA/YrhL
MQYRREVDGLRTLAVVPVILFHAGFNFFSGGFVGVDIFFVISGYLITTILVSEKEYGTFSLINFYERRARRILPALFVVMFFCLPCAWLWLLPQDMERFARSLVAVSTYTSNILFWFESGYFDTSAEFKPLLHTWSLAVEEQYYLFFPIFLTLIWKLGRKNIFVILVFISILSLGVAQWGASAKPASTFYFLPTRAWEFLIGSLVSLYLGSKRPPDNRFINEVSSFTGLTLIIFSIFFFNKQTPFPSFYTLAPTVGAALIILSASPQTAVGKLLGTKAFVGVGLISYSMYLWHQPLFAFARHGTTDEPSKLLMSTLILATAVLGYISWRFIERAFRSKEEYTQRFIFRWSAIGSIFFILVGLAQINYKYKTYWEVLNPTYQNLPVALETGALKECPKPHSMPTIACKVHGSGKTRVVLWGDSHAGALASEIPNIEGVEFYVLTLQGCPPLLGVRRFDGLGSSINCNKISVLNSYAEYIKAVNPNFVILAGRWTLYINGWQNNGALNPQHHFLSTSDSESEPKPFTERKTIFEEQLKTTIKYFSPKSKVLIVSQAPDFSNYGFKGMERFNVSAPVAEINHWHEGELDVLERMRQLDGLIVIDSKSPFCNSSVCQTREHGVLLYTDDNHLSTPAIKKVWDLIRRRSLDFTVE